MHLSHHARKSVLVSLSIAMLVLAGCSRESGGAENQPPPAAVPEVEATPAAPVQNSPAVPAPATVGGDGSAITLSPLSATDLQGANLAGELGCSFSTTAASPILVAMGNVASKDPAFGVVKVGDYVERVAAPGGFDAMIKGVTFSGQGKTVRIDLTGAAAGGGESPPRPATLTYDRADGAKLVLPGQWTCGP